MGRAQPAGLESSSPLEPVDPVDPWPRVSMLLGEDRVIGKYGFWALGVLVCGFMACAPVQQVPITVEPVPVTIFVDGRRLPEAGRQTVELKANRGHVFQFEKEGYRSQQVVLVSREWEGHAHLQPEDIFVQLIPLEGRKPEIEVGLEAIEERGTK